MSAACMHWQTWPTAASRSSNTNPWRARQTRLSTVLYKLNVAYEREMAQNAIEAGNLASEELARQWANTNGAYRTRSAQANVDPQELQRRTAEIRDARDRRTTATYLSNKRQFERQPGLVNARIDGASSTPAPSPATGSADMDMSSAGSAGQDPKDKMDESD